MERAPTTCVIRALPLVLVSCRAYTLHRLLPTESLRVSPHLGSCGPVAELCDGVCPGLIRAPRCFAGPYLSTCQTPRRTRYRMIGLLLLIGGPLVWIPGQVHPHISSARTPMQEFSGHIFTSTLRQLDAYR